MIALDSIVYLSPYMLSVVFPLALGLFVWHRNKSYLGLSFSMLLFAQSIWSATVFMEIV